MAEHTPTCIHPDGCDRARRVGAWCKGHYTRISRTGDPGPSALAPLRNPRPPRSCSIEGCDDGHVARGLCKQHWTRMQRYGDPLGSPTRQPDTCIVDDCAEPCKARSMCATHYRRWRTNGDPLIVKRPGKPAGTDHHNWLGDDIGYRAAHDRVRRLHGSPKRHACAHCGTQAYDWAYDHSDPNETRDAQTGMRYSTSPQHYIALCRACHQVFDQPYRQRSAT